MKKNLIFVLTFFLLIKLGHGQKDWQCLINFENYLYCYSDTLVVDTANNHNNDWEIGQPNKTTFQSAYSAPNAIVTKLDTSYSINDTSSFIILHVADMALNDYGTMWIDAVYRINSDTLTDYGTIEFSPDNGLTWIDLMTDTVYSQQGIYHWTNVKPIFSGNSSGWQSFDLWITDHNHTFNLIYGDTVLFRFTFISDSIQTFKDGWMFDDIDINDWYEGIPDLNSMQGNIIIYPNPISSQAVFTFDYPLKDATLTVYNLLGQNVRQLKNINGGKVIFNSYNLSNGLYFIRVTENNRVIASDKIEIKE